MPEVWAGRLGEFRATSTADGGTALTTTAGFIQFPTLTKAGDNKQCHLFITARNFVTAVVAKIILNPWLTILKTTDSMVASPTDYSIEAQDNDTGTSVDISSLNTVANGDWLLVGSHLPIRGVDLDIDGTNSTASRTLTVAYWNGGSWISYTLSYSVAWTTAFDADTTVSWTPTTNWAKTTFKKLYPEHTTSYYFSEVPLYWTRWSVDGALDATVTIDAMLSANRSTSYGELLAGQAFEERAVYGFGGLGCIEALTNAGTANLIVDVATLHDGEF